jgi:hypothetical protein
MHEGKGSIWVYTVTFGSPGGGDVVRQLAEIWPEGKEALNVRGWADTVVNRYLSSRHTQSFISSEGCCSVSRRVLFGVLPHKENRV